jgi:hypothetical protein
MLENKPNLCLMQLGLEDIRMPVALFCKRLAFSLMLRHRRLRGCWQVHPEICLRMKQTHYRNLDF